MKQTANYQLNQWEQADRILMADFNADNLKVDGALAGLQTALSAETAARQAADTALESKSRFTKISEVSLSSNTASWEISLSGIDWTQWDRVHLDFYMQTDTSFGIYLDSEASGNYLSGFDGFSSFCRLPRVTLAPEFRADRLVSGQIGTGRFMLRRPFSQISKLLMKGCTFYAGSTVALWGEK